MSWKFQDTQFNHGGFQFRPSIQGLKFWVDSVNPEQLTLSNVNLTVQSSELSTVCPGVYHTSLLPWACQTDSRRAFLLSFSDGARLLALSKRQPRGRTEGALTRRAPRLVVWMHPLHRCGCFTVEWRREAEGPSRSVGARLPSGD